jgi:hypothetical protein
MSTMKRVGIASLVVLVAVAVFGVSLALAQGIGPWGPMGAMMQTWQAGTPVPGMGPGMMGDGWDPGRMMDGDRGPMHAWMSQNAGMHPLVWDALADALGLTPEALQAELEAGQTLAIIAAAQGVKTADLAAAMEAAMQIGLEQAVVEGALTQAQADQMLDRMAGRYAWMVEHMAGGDPGAMMSGGMMGGRGAGVCPHNITTAPGIDG